MLAEFSLPIALAGSFVVGLLGDVASQKFVEGKSFDNINLTQAVGVGLLNMVLTLPAVGLSRIVRNSGITNAQSFLFGLVSNAPLIGVSTMGNSLISQISTIFSIGHLKKNIISGILYILETHMKEIIINKKGYYCHAI